MKRFGINMAVQDQNDMNHVIEEFEEMGVRVLHKTFNYLMDDWVVEGPEDKIMAWLEAEGYDGPWNGQTDGLGWYEDDGATVELPKPTPPPLRLTRRGKVVAVMMSVFAIAAAVWLWCTLVPPTPLWY